MKRSSRITCRGSRVFVHSFPRESGFTEEPRDRKRNPSGVEIGKGERKIRVGSDSNSTRTPYIYLRHPLRSRCLPARTSLQGCDTAFIATNTQHKLRHQLNHVSPIQYASIYRLLFHSEKSPPPYEPINTHSRISRRGARKLAKIAALILGITTLLNLDSAVHLVHANFPNQQKEFFQGLENCYRSRDSERSGLPQRRRENPRWHPENGQKAAVVLRNATLFDGEWTNPSSVDILFEKGVIISITPTPANTEYPKNAEILEIGGKFVTPGLVDMYSHHLLVPYPQLPATRDVNEKTLGPTTPFV